MTRFPLVALLLSAWSQPTTIHRVIVLARAGHVDRERSRAGIPSISGARAPGSREPGFTPGH